MLRPLDFLCIGETHRTHTTLFRYLAQTVLAVNYQSSTKNVADTEACFEGKGPANFELLETPEHETGTDPYEDFNSSDTFLGAQGYIANREEVTSGV